MGRKKKKKVNPLKCGFCQIYQTIPSKKWRTDGSHIKIVRFCEYAKDYVGPTSVVCDNFVPAKYINCVNFNRRISILACIKRLNNGECTRCRIKKAIYIIEKLLENNKEKK